METVTVIGIDPGSRFTGWGLVREQSGVLHLIACGLINALGAGRQKKTMCRSDSFSCRLAHIYQELSAVLKKHSPQEAAIEQVFTAHNPASALKLGQARGVAVAACAENGIPISDYEPTVVKKSLVGTGRADKDQVAFMVNRLLNLKAGEWPLDVTDAIGVAICHINSRHLAIFEKQ